MIDATVGGPNANSYVTLAEADAYFAGRTGAEAWATSDREPALITAAARLDVERYVGQRATATQALQFPRADIKDDDGREIPENVVPARVKRAQMEAALELVTGTLSLAPTGLEGFRRAKIGPMDVETRDTIEAGSLSATVKRFLRPWLLDSGANVRLVLG